MFNFIFEEPLIFLILGFSIAITINNYIFLCIFLTIVLIFLIYFYRSPIITYPELSNNVITSPAFGTVCNISELQNTNSIAIFLSPMDVHIQYIPFMNSTVKSIEFDYNGKFELAYNVNKSKDNEKCITKFDNGITITQIAGFLVRRIINECNVGDVMYRGDKMGMIKFGSRVDIELPKKYKILVKNGDKVDPNTILAI